MQAERLISLIIERRSRTNSGSTLLVAIDGRGGSGKTTLADIVSAAVPGVRVVHTDDFALPRRVRPLPSGDQGTDWNRLFLQMVRPLKRDQPANYQRYSWDADALEEWIEVRPRGIVIIEGVGVLRLETRQLFDIRVWVDCPRDICLTRGLERDGSTSNRTQWDIWQTGEDSYIDKDDPMAAADLVIVG